MLWEVRSNITAQIFPFMNLSTILNVFSNDFTNSNADGGGAGGVGKDALQSALMFPPNYQVYDAEGNYMRYRSTANPAEMAMFNDNTKSSGWYVNLSTDIKLYKDILKFRGVYGFNRENTRRTLYIPTTMMWYEVAGVSRGHIGDASRDDQTLEGMLSYSQKFADIVGIDAMIGMGWYKQSGTGLEVDFKNANDNIGADNIAAAEGPFTPTSGRWENEKRSQFGRLAVDLLDRYIISASVRRDGTDKFFPGKKYAWFPSVSAAWKISSEKWMENIEWINLLKIRGSYGVTGRDNLGTSLYGLYTMAPSYVKNNGNGGQLYDLYNNGTSTVYAQGNVWNVAVQDSASIEQVVTHFADNPNLGLVIFMPAGEVEPSSINDVTEAAPVESIRYFNILGRESEKPFEGVNIVVTRFTNGKVSTSKQLW